MAQIAKENIIKGDVEVLGILEYIEKYNKGIHAQAIHYAILKDKIDYVRIGNERLIVMTDKTKQYVPNNNYKRDIPKGRKRSVKVKRTSGIE